MRLQIHLEFQQNEIKRLNEKYNKKVFSLHVCVCVGGGGGGELKLQNRKLKSL